MIKLSGKKLFIVLAVVILLLCAGIVLLFSMKKKAGTTKQDVNLTYWGVYDAPEVIQPIIDKYETENPHVKITYVQKKFATYEEDLRNAFASSNPPDIFELQNMMIPKYQYLIEPLPDTDATLIDQYFDVVADDAVIDKKVYGLPYSVDSLVLYYNKRLFSEAGITNPPRTWDDFDAAIQKLTKIDATGRFIQSGAAIGGSELDSKGQGSINRATDILSLFMLQKGTSITDRTKDSLIWEETSTSPTGDKVEKPNLQALSQYLRYSNATEPVYTWNDAQNYSFDVFAQEKVGMILSYAYALPIIRGNNPKMQLGITPLPQPKDANEKITYANYWMETVSAQSANKDVAWDFLKFATNKENVKLYSSETNKPVSRKDLVNEELNDADLGAFALQNLYARSWYQYDGAQVETILDTMLKSILKGTVTQKDALEKAGNEIAAVLQDGATTRRAIEEAAKKAEAAAKALQDQANAKKTKK